MNLPTTTNKRESFQVSEHLAQSGIQPVVLTPVAMIPGQSQTLTLLYQSGKLDLLSERNHGNQWRRSITVQPENIDQLIAGLTAIRKAQRAGKLAATVTIRDGAILK